MPKPSPDYEGIAKAANRIASEETDRQPLPVERVLATALSVGDKVRLIGLIWFQVEWMAVDPGNGAAYLAGHTKNGRPHVSSLSEAAMVDRLI